MQTKRGWIDEERYCRVCEEKEALHILPHGRIGRGGKDDGPVSVRNRN